MRQDDQLAGARAVARWLDTAGRVPGTNIRFGLDPILGLVPGLGDVAGAALTGYIVLVGARLGAPRSVVVRMLMNVAVDTLVGTIPVLGDVFDVGWKSNIRNIALLERYLEQPSTTTRSSRVTVAAAIATLTVLAAAGVAAAVFVLKTLVTLLN